MATEHNQSACKLCVYADEHGWWGMTDLTHCRKCGATWSLGTKAQHCTVCHHTFTSESAAQAHVVGGKCIDPEVAVYPDTNKRAGEPVLTKVFNRWGTAVWRGANTGDHKWAGGQRS